MLLASFYLFKDWHYLKPKAVKTMSKMSVQGVLFLWFYQISKKPLGILKIYYTSHDLYFRENNSRQNRSWLSYFNYKLQGDFLILPILKVSLLCY